MTVAARAKLTVIFFLAVTQEGIFRIPICSAIPFKVWLSYEANADKRLEHLAQRAYSRQWSVPEDINKKVVDELKSRFAGKVFGQELRLLIWDIDDLEAYCKKS